MCVGWMADRLGLTINTFVDLKLEHKPTFIQQISLAVNHFVVAKDVKEKLVVYEVCCHLLMRHK